METTDDLLDLIFFDAQDENSVACFTHYVTVYVKFEVGWPKSFLVWSHTSDKV